MKKRLNRDKFKLYSKMRNNPEKYIPHHLCYCYGVIDGKGYGNCKFLVDQGLNSYLDKYRHNVYKKEGVYNMDVAGLSAKCSFTGHWIFDYCKHCKINMECKLDKNGERIW